MKLGHVPPMGLCVPSLSSFHIPAFMKCYEIRYYRKHCLIALLYKACFWLNFSSYCQTTFTILKNLLPAENTDTSSIILLLELCCDAEVWSYVSARFWFRFPDITWVMVTKCSCLLDQEESRETWKPCRFLVHCCSPRESHVLLAYKLEMSKQNMGSGHIFGIQIIHLVLLRKMWGIFLISFQRKVEKDTSRTVFASSLYLPLRVPLALSVTLLWFENLLVSHRLTIPSQPVSPSNNNTSPFKKGSSSVQELSPLIQQEKHITV